MAIKDKSTSRLAPKLRFPEFNDGPDWAEVPLDSLAMLVKTRNVDRNITRVLTNSAERGVLDQRDYFEREIASADGIDNYFVVERGDYVYNPRKSIIAPVGPISRNNLDTGVMSPLYTVFRFKDGSTDFYEHYFKSTSWHDYLRGASSTGARHDRMAITGTVFMRMPVPLPPGAEQSKIASCLTSLDDLLVAEGRKLEAIRAHKKGLMRELFPREGESRAALRFPEFHDAGGWEEIPLEQVIDVVSGQVDPTEPPYCDLPHVGGENIESETGNIQHLKSARQDGVISGKYLFDERHILYSKIRPALNKVAAPDFQGICSADIYPIRPSSKRVLREYLVYLLRAKSFVDYATRHSARGKIPKINREALLAYRALMPLPAEQRRIADCLASLDALIAAASRKFNGLRAHKKGLMLQLFPSADKM